LLLFLIDQIINQCSVSSTLWLRGEALLSWKWPFLICIFHTFFSEKATLGVSAFIKGKLERWDKTKQTINEIKRTWEEILPLEFKRYSMVMQPHTWPASFCTCLIPEHPHKFGMQNHASLGNQYYFLVLLTFLINLYMTGWRLMIWCSSYTMHSHIWVPWIRSGPSLTVQ
jgi:hypothetical protein